MILPPRVRPGPGRRGWPHGGGAGGRARAPARRRAAGGTGGGRGARGQEGAGPGEADLGLVGVGAQPELGGEDADEVEAAQAGGGGKGVQGDVLRVPVVEELAGALQGDACRAGTRGNRGPLRAVLEKQADAGGEARLPVERGGRPPA